MSYPVRFPKKIVTFLGAGASTPFGYPTTKTFLEKLSTTTSGEEKALLNSIRSLHWTVEDVEHVVEILDLILELNAVSEKGRLAAFIRRNPLSVTFEEGKELKRYSPQLVGEFQWERLVRIVEKLRENVVQLTFKEYESKVGQYQEIKKVYSAFFRLLQEYSNGGMECEVFTTNYDNVIEDYSRSSSTSCTLSVHNQVVCNGDKQFGKIALNKLHGSLDWMIDKETKKVAVSTTQALVIEGSTRWDRNEFVIFGTKPRLEEAEIYQKLMLSFSESLGKAEVCIVIGFSFRDQHINEIFTKALERNHSLRLLIVSRSPKEAAKNLIQNSKQLSKLLKDKRLVPIRCSFGTAKALNQIGKELG